MDGPQKVKSVETNSDRDKTHRQRKTATNTRDIADFIEMQFFKASTSTMRLSRQPLFFIFLGPGAEKKSVHSRVSDRGSDIKTRHETK